MYQTHISKAVCRVWIARANSGQVVVIDEGKRPPMYQSYISKVGWMVGTGYVQNCMYSLF